MKQDSEVPIKGSNVQIWITANQLQCDCYDGYFGVCSGAIWLLAKRSGHVV